MNLWGAEPLNDHAYRMIERRARAAGIKTKIGNHSLRATGITDYLKSDGTRENAQAMANHSSPRTTKLYDRRSDETSLDERKSGDLRGELAKLPLFISCPVALWCARHINQL